MLGREYDGIDGDGFAVFIAEGDLALGIGFEPGQGAIFSDFRLTFNQAVRIGYGRRHQHVGLVGGVAEHHALVAGTLFMVLGLIHAHGDIGRLFAYGVEHSTGITVEAAFGVVVTDIVDYFPDHALYIDIGFGCYFPRHHHHSGFYHGLTGNA